MCTRPLDGAAVKAPETGPSSNVTVPACPGLTRSVKRPPDRLCVVPIRRAFRPGTCSQALIRTGTRYRAAIL